MYSATCQGHCPRWVDWPAVTSGTASLTSPHVNWSCDNCCELLPLQNRRKCNNNNISINGDRIISVTAWWCARIGSAKRVRISVPGSFVPRRVYPRVGRSRFVARRVYPRIAVPGSLYTKSIGIFARIVVRELFQTQFQLSSPFSRARNRYVQCRFWIPKNPDVEIKNRKKINVGNRKRNWNRKKLWPVFKTETGGKKIIPVNETEKLFFHFKPCYFLYRINDCLNI